VGLREDLDRVAVLELPVQRRDPAVDLGALAVRAHVGVDVERRKSIGVEPLGSRFTSPFGVNTKISSWYRSTLRNSRNSSGTVGVLLQLEQLAEPAEVLVQLVRLPSFL
jgi:hypothetical protein